MKKIFILLAIVLNVLIGYTQTKLEIAEEAFNNRQYNIALESFKKVLSGKLKNRSEVSFKIAECYRFQENYTEALKWYENAKKEGYSQPNLFFKIAKTSILLEDYAQAQNNLNEFLQFQANDKEALRMLENIKFAQSQDKQTSIYTTQSITALNSVYSDYGIVPVNNKVIFTSSRIDVADAANKRFSYNNQGYSSLYESTYNINEKTWQKPVKIEAISSPFNDGAITYCEKTKTAYFTQCNGKTGKDELCQIFESTLNSKGFWSAPKPIVVDFDVVNDLQHPSISADGQTLYFVSSMPNGKGGSDIWSLKKKGTKWGNLTNLNEAINSSYNEMFPYIFQDTILYFSSEGHPGFGGLDIFFSVLKAGTWSKPENLNAPFNSAADDFYLVFINQEKSEGYFSSNRTSGRGSDDLYTFYLTPINITVKGLVLDTETKLPLANKLVILSTANMVLDSVYTNSNGEYVFKLDKNKDYKINIAAQGYFGDSKKLSTQGQVVSKDFSKQNGYNYDFVIKRIPKEEINIEDIYYDYDSYNIREDSKANLDILVKLLEDTPEAIIQINSHTDARGKYAYNMELSRNRAKAVVDYLISKGINGNRLSFKGWGATNTIIKNAKTEEQHQLNRRTTFTVINN